MPFSEKDIPGYCFLTSQFLISFEHNKHHSEYAAVHQHFLDSLVTTPVLTDFHYYNPGAVVMMCYGLMVFPVEFWRVLESDPRTMSGLESYLKVAAAERGEHAATFSDLFVQSLSPAITDPARFLRKIRNAIAHAHIEVDVPGNSYRFWNTKDDKTIDFDARISVRQLSVVLTAIGRFFANHSQTMP